MSVIISTLFDALLSKVLPTMNVAKPITDTAGQVLDDSYDALTKYTRVEPFCVIDNTLVGQHYTEALYGVSLNILIGYYLQAVSLINVGHGIPPIKMLRRLSPEGGLQMATAEAVSMRAPGLRTTEARGTRGPRRPINNGNRGNGRPINNGNQRNGPRPPFRNRGNPSNPQPAPAPKPTPTPSPEMRVGRPTINEVRKSNAVIGKTITIDFNTGAMITPITVNVRYDIMEAPPEVMIQYLSTGSPDHDYLTRLRQYRAGKIRFWKDLIFATDLLDEQRKLMLMDKNNLMKSVIERRGMAVANAATGGGRNYGVSSNCVIISTDTLERAEGVMKGTIDNPRVRDSIFHTLSALILVVVDKEYERFTFYFRNKPIPTTVSAKILKSSMTGDKEDSLEALAKALSGTRPVSF